MKSILILMSITLLISCFEEEKSIEISFGKHDLINNSLAKS